MCYHTEGLRLKVASLLTVERQYPEMDLVDGKTTGLPLAVVTQSGMA